MKKVVTFNSEDEFIAYRENKTFMELGSGSSGTCYIGEKGLVYKDLTDGFNNDGNDLEGCLTTDDIKVDSFIFPETLFAVDGKLVGYTSKYIRGNKFSLDIILVNRLDYINFENLINAYYKMKEDAILLAQNGIKIFDLSYNIVFDGKKLYGIDTDYYRKVDYDVLEHNISCVNAAIIDEICMILEYEYDEVDDIDRNMDVESFLRMVKKRYVDIYDDEPKIFIK